MDPKNARVLPPTAFLALLRQQVEEGAISISELERRTGLARSTIRNALGGSPAFIDTVERIAEACGARTVVLFYA